MTISYPYSLLDSFPGWTTEFDLFYRQEQSRTSDGVTYVKDFGSPLWQATWQSRSMSPNELDKWRAILKSLEGGLKQFIAYPMSRCYPIAYPNGADMGTVSGAAVNSFNSDNNALSIKGLPAGYKVSVGDYVQVGTYNLHQALEAGTGAVTAQLAIRPHLWPVSAVNDAVVVVKPSCLMTLVPGSISSTADLTTGRGIISFQGIESR
ncbi:hypothetical protein LB579_31160 [Mesorhizobium sp. BR1-1-7]|uniref:hypothetical protein n=1 Tax=Mesorhizobium sp. BR1-1-7 TaxID=2876647 RepID=UPI001CCCEF03|nr:hypothetical protein [Mesorhizobium sp. BR1-1-7]MBZ9922145.1 hypothetical protein [Mesorhizobium sp. BR1-1-7]